MMEGMAMSFNRLQKSQDQGDIGRTGDEKPDRERQLGALTEGLKAGSHARTIRRF